MKVKAGNKVYDIANEPVMVILTERDKLNIANMLEDATRYCSYPEHWNSEKYENILDWMKDGCE